jgi:hypothetical protein
MDFFDPVYRGTPPWDIGRPRKEFVELVRRGDQGVCYHDAPKIVKRYHVILRHSVTTFIIILGYIEVSTFNEVINDKILSILRETDSR